MGKGKFTDHDIIKKIRIGDRDAVILLIRNTEKLVAQVVFKMVSRPSDRKDLIQDIYLKVFKNLHDFRFESKLSTWIGQISYNTCLNHIKKKRPDFHELNYFDKADSMDPNYIEIGKDEIDASELMMLKERTVILAKFRKDLPPIFNTLITLYHQEELSVEEIVDITGLPNGTVKNYLFRARKVLKEKLLAYYLKEDL